MPFETIGQRPDAVIRQLDSYLRGELSACEAYRMALGKLESPFRERLGECLRSHERRCDDLRRRILLLGGEPSERSGAWGALARLVEGGARLFGPRAAIAALEEGEDHGLADYRRGLDDLDTETRAFVLTHLVSEQERTHRICSELRQSFH
jgi:hypothetical protein